MIRVDYVTLIDGTVEEMRGYTYSRYHEAIAEWRWEAPASAVAIPIHRIAMIRETEEAE